MVKMKTIFFTGMTIIFMKTRMLTRMGIFMSMSMGFPVDPCNLTNFFENCVYMRFSSRG